VCADIFHAGSAEQGVNHGVDKSISVLVGVQS
jgi:hypothetical protein